MCLYKNLKKECIIIEENGLMHESVEKGQNLFYPLKIIEQMKNE